MPPTPRSFSAAMHCCVASIAQRDQVVLRIFARVAPKSFMVHLKVGHRAARLASPAVATQHLVAKIVVLLGIEPHGCRFRSDPVHDAFSVTWSVPPQLEMEEAFVR